MEGIDPITGLSVSGAVQAAERLKRAITTEVGTREKRRKVGGKLRKLFGIANNYNRMIIINRIHRIIEDPHNDLQDIKNAEIDVRIHGAGYRISIHYDYEGQRESLSL
ncbi:conserved hypothetical protein [Vibrio chagasii]|nr:conserved hypothetical protein [Vibrio chagasii]|tara:strand:+ start:33674 stop:33997 length:324 start_codon:yes stop_codon:yes gene_type:complete